MKYVLFVLSLVFLMSCTPKEEMPIQVEAKPDLVQVTHNILLSETEALQRALEPLQYIPAMLVRVVNDGWGRPFVYTRVNPTTCTLCSLGADGAPTPDDECATLTMNDVNFWVDPIWSAEKQEALCKEIQGYDEDTGFYIPENFRSQIPTESIDAMDMCITSVIEKIVKDARVAEADVRIVDAVSYWRLVSRLTGNPKWVSQASAIEKVMADNPQGQRMPIYQAREIFRDFQSNEITASTKYKEDFALIGVIRQISKDMLGNPYIMFSAGAYQNVQCLFPNTANAFKSLSELKKGESAGIVCRNGRVPLVDPVFDCTFFLKGSTPRSNKTHVFGAPAKPETID